MLIHWSGFDIYVEGYSPSMVNGYSARCELALTLQGLMKPRAQENKKNAIEIARESNHKVSVVDTNTKNRKMVTDVINTRKEAGGDKKSK